MTTEVVISNVIIIAQLTNTVRCDYYSIHELIYTKTKIVDIDVRR